MYKAWMKHVIAPFPGALPLQTCTPPFLLKINKLVRPCPLPVIFYNFPCENLNNFKTLTIHLLI